MSNNNQATEKSEINLLPKEERLQEQKELKRRSTKQAPMQVSMHQPNNKKVKSAIVKTSWLNRLTNIFKKSS